MYRSLALLLLSFFCLFATAGAAAAGAPLPLRPSTATAAALAPSAPLAVKSVADFGADGDPLIVGIDGRAAVQLAAQPASPLRLHRRPLVARPGDLQPLLALTVAADAPLPPARLVVDLRALPAAAAGGGHFYLARRDPQSPGRWIEAPLTVHDPGGLISAPLIGSGEWEAGLVPEAWRPAYEPPAADAYSGAASYEYALPLPAARGTWTPALALRYNSRGVDGRIVDSADPAHIADGWTLTATRIVRENVHLDADTAQRPVLVYPELYRLLLDGAGYRLQEVAREGSRLFFSAAGLPGARIIRHTLPVVDGRQRFYWTIERANGVRLRLGYDLRAVAFQSTPHDVHIRLDAGDAGVRQAEFAWGVDLVVDPYGNGAHFTYLTRTLEETLSFPDGGQQLQVVFATTANRLLSLRYNYPNLVGDGWPALSPPAGVPATTVFFRATAGDDLQAGTFVAPLSRISLFQAAEARPLAEIRLETTVWGHESAGCDGYFTRSRIVTGLQQLAGTDADPATDDAGSAALPQVSFGYAMLPHYTDAQGDCFYVAHLNHVDNGYGATTTFDYLADGRIVGSYLHTPWATILPQRGLSYLVSSATNSAGDAPVRAEYVYEGLCYGQAAQEVVADIAGSRGCGSPWIVDDGPLLGADRVTVQTVAADGTPLRKMVETFAQAQYEEEEQIRGRSLERRLIDGNGALLLRETTTYEAGANGSGMPFFYAATTAVAIHDALTGAGLVRGTRRHFLPALQGDAQYGNLTLFVDQGDLARQGDERSTVTCFAPETGEAHWLVDRPFLSRVFAGELPPERWQRSLCDLDYRSSDLLLESRTIYDGAPLGTPPQHGGMTASWLGLPGAALAGGTEGLLPGSTRTIDEWGNLVALTENNGKRTVLTYDLAYQMRPTRVDASGPGVAAQTSTYRYYGLEGAPGAANGLPMPLGALQEQVTPAGLVTRYEYDPFGRLFATYDSAGDQGQATDPWDGNPRARQRYWDNTWNDDVLMTAPLAVAEELRPAVFATGRGSSSRRTMTYLDGYGRAIQVRSSGSEVNGIPADVVALLGYDAQGHVRCRAVPFAVAPAAGFVSTGCQETDHLAMELDELGRTVQEERPSGAVTRYAYRVEGGELQRIRVAANGHQQRESWDAAGRRIAFATTLAVCDARCLPASAPWHSYGETRTAYDLLDRPVKVVDPNERTTGLVYDALGRKVRLDDPSAGAWAYGYDQSNNLVWQEDPRGQRLCFDYDAYNRPVEKWSVTTGDCDSRHRRWLATYSYDVQADGSAAPGLLTGIDWAPSGSANGERISYDARQRPMAVTRTVDGVAYTQRTTAYDWFDRPLEEVLPNGRVVTYSYDALGATQLRVDGRDVVGMVRRDALGRVTMLGLGNGVVTRYSYGSAATDYRLRGMAVERSGQTLLGLAYAYDATGNLVRQDELGVGDPGFGLQQPPVGLVDRLEFGYDALDRLVAARGDHPAFAYDRQYTYDPAGNLQAVSDNLTGGVTAYAYESTRPRLVTAAGDRLFSYDAAGFMLARVDGEEDVLQQYDAPGRLTAVTVAHELTRERTRLFYDDGQQPVRIVAPDGAVRHQPFADLQIDDVGTPAARWQMTYRLGGLPVALDVGGGNAPGRYYVHGDQVGSRLFLTYGADHDLPGRTVAGKAVPGSQARYLPYGGSRLAPEMAVADAHFGGHPRLEELGLVQVGVRFYLPSLARFLTPDALAPTGKLRTAENVNALTLSYSEEVVRLTHNRAARTLMAHPLPGSRPADATALGLSGPVQLDRYGYADYRPVQEADPTGHFSFWVDIDLETAQALLDSLLGDNQGNPGLLNLLGLGEGALDGVGTITAALVGLVATPVAGLLAGLALYVVSRQVSATLDGLETFAQALRNAIAGGGGDQIRITVDHGLIGDQITVSRRSGGSYSFRNGLFDRSGDLLIGWMSLADHGADVMWEIGGIVYYWRRSPAYN